MAQPHRNGQSQIKQPRYEILWLARCSVLLGCACVNFLPVPLVQWLCLIEQEGAWSVSWGFLLSKAVWLGVKAVLLSPPFSWLSRAAHLAPGECMCVTHLSLQAWGVQKLFQPGVQSSQKAFVMLGKVFCCCFKERRWRYSLSIICYGVKRVLLVNELDSGRILEIPPRCLVPLTSEQERTEFDGTVICTTLEDGGARYPEWPRASLLPQTCPRFYPESESCSSSGWTASSQG